MADGASTSKAANSRRTDAQTRGHAALGTAYRAPR